MKTASTSNNTRIFTIFLLIVGFSFNLKSQDYIQGQVNVSVKEEYIDWFQEDRGSVLGYLAQFGITEIKAFEDYLLHPYPNKTSPYYKRFCGLYELYFDPNLGVTEQVDILLSTELFSAIEPNYIFEVMTDSYQPNDPYADSTLGPYAGMNQLILHDFYSAFAVEKGDTNVIVGVIDTGCDFDQEDSKGNLKYNWEDPVDSINNDGDFIFEDSLTDNYRGWDVADHDNDPTMGPGSNHGARMISIIAATPDNDTGIVGTGFNCKYIPYKASYNEYSNSITHGYIAMIIAAEQGCRVVNCSWGTTLFSSDEEMQIFEDFVKTMFYDYNMVIVSAAGNNDSEFVYYPASFEGVISVTAINPDSCKTPAGNYNHYVDLGAAGFVRFESSKGDYRTDNGTSVASAVVSGLAALTCSAFPEYTSVQIREQLLVTADVHDTLACLQPYENKIGKRINPLRSVTDSTTPGLNIYNFAVNDSIATINTDGEVVYLDLSIVNVLNPSSNVTYKITPMTDNFEVIDSIGEIDDLSMWDSLHIKDQIQIEILPSSAGKQYFVARVDFVDSLNYTDHQYLFFDLESTEITSNKAFVDDESVSLFPNPFKNEFYIEFDSFTPEEINLFNESGEALEINWFQKESKFVVNPLGNLPTGVYFVQLIGQGQEIVTKALKFTE